MTDNCSITFQQLIERVRAIFADDRVNVDEVKQLLDSYHSNPKDWKRYAKFDAHKYTRNLVDIGNDNYNLMILCWGEGMGSSIHDHGNAHCFVKMLQGTLKETQFEWPTQHDAPMIEKETNYIKTDAVTYINDDIALHRMENPSHSDGAVSLHVYIPPYEECRAFDQRTGKTRNCPVTFWSTFGKRQKDEISLTTLFNKEKTNPNT